jgi:ABC-type sugar transport system ATPase subunit
MDEPTAALAVAEVRKVLGFIDRLRAQGKSVVLISHNIQDVFAISDRITVLRQGRRVALRETRATTPEEIIGFITGAFEAARRAPSERGAVHEEARS